MPHSGFRRRESEGHYPRWGFPLFDIYVFYYSTNIPLTIEAIFSYTYILLKVRNYKSRSCRCILIHAHILHKKIKTPAVSRKRAEEIRAAETQIQIKNPSGGAFMETIIIASSREGAGKTSIIVGIATALEKKYGYIKPFGDRLIYRRKKNWDYDANLIVNILGLEEEPDKISLGFNHAKLRYVYNEDATRTTCQEMAENSGKDKDVLFVEGGKDLTYGASIHLDAIALSKYLNGKLVIVVSGDSDTIVDDIRYINKYIKTQDAGFAGIIINKVQDLEEFENVFLKGIRDLGINVLGVIPYKDQLTHFTMNYLAENLFAKVIAGEKGLGNVVKNIFVGAMSTDESLRNPLFIKEQKLLITSGDRSDMILAALESDTVGILLTNNILPPANIITRASEKNIPLLLVANDTFMVSKQLDRMEALLTRDSENEIELLAQLVTKYVKLDELIQ